MSMMDKIKSMFGGGAAASNDKDHAGHDHAGHDHSHDAPAAPLDPVGTTAPDPAPEGDHQH